jgi:hypothetical protein
VVDQNKPGVAQPSVPQGENQQFNPDTHVKGGDGQIYEKKVVSATGVAAGLHDGAPQTALAAALEKAMTEAAQKAHDEGLTNPDEVRARILAARDQVIEQPPQQAQASQDESKSNG